MCGCVMDEKEIYEREPIWEGTCLHPIIDFLHQSRNGVQR